ncbi:MAG: hypothetical protein ABMA26_17920 [Limisphaerales bacterium]
MDGSACEAFGLATSDFGAQDHSQKLRGHIFGPQNRQLAATRCRFGRSDQARFANGANDGKQNVASVQVRAAHVLDVKRAGRDVVWRTLLNEDMADTVLSAIIRDAFFSKLVGDCEVVSIGHATERGY